MSECNTELLQEIFDRGLVKGLGTEGGQMGIEAAVALACGEPFSDKPTCVAEPDRIWAIGINDASWGYPEFRSKALLPLALAQLGTAGTDRSAWITKVIEGTIRRILPKALKDATNYCPDHSEALLSAAQRCEDEGSEEAAEAAYTSIKGTLVSVNAANAAARVFSKDVADAAAAIRGIYIAANAAKATQIFRDSAQATSAVNTANEAAAEAAAAIEAATLANHSATADAACNAYHAAAAYTAAYAAVRATRAAALAAIYVDYATHAATGVTSTETEAGITEAAKSAEAAYVEAASNIAQAITYTNYADTSIRGKLLQEAVDIALEAYNA